MCRLYQLWGCILSAFGLGVLIGLWFEGGFFSHCFGFGMILLGCFVGKRK